jgi:hypothetical protein
MAEDFDALRRLVAKMTKTDFRHGWQFRVEISAPKSLTVSPPEDLDIYIKDITYDPIEITTETETICGHTFTWPVSVSPTTITMTMRDNVDQRVRKWFEAFTSNIIETDGTVKHFDLIEMEFKRYALKPDGTDGDSETWWVIPTKLGEITESRDECGDIEFPIVFVQNRTTRPPKAT